MKADGRKLESLSFSAWGERRAADWNPSGVATPALDLARNWGLTQGFTGHEADEPWGLINMKGGIYDPVVGRFLSADPFIQFTTNTQSYNRYTYVLNNPLSLTDPTGYSSKSWFDVIRTVVSIAIAVLMPPTATLPMIMAVNAASTTVLTYMATGSLETALVSGFQAGIMSGLSAGVSDAIGGSKVIGNALGGWGAHIAHGVVQGTLSVLQGGKFGSGFAAGFMGHGARNLGAKLGFGVPHDPEGLMGRTVVAAMVGGLSSKITGGTFANGAISAAFVHLFNAEGMHYDPLPPQEDYDPN